MIASLILWSLVSLSSQGSTDKLSYERICGNLEGAFSISHPELVIDTILENNLVTVFMNYSREYVFECKSSIPSDQDNVREPPTEIRFGSKRLNHQFNKYAGKYLYIFMFIFMFSNFNITLSIYFLAIFIISQYRLCISWNIFT